MIVSSILAIVVIAEGAYIVRTRSQVAALSERLEALSAAQLEDDVVARPPAPARAGAESDDEPARREARPAPRLSVPRFTPEPVDPAASADPLPLPPAISSPEAREQLRQFVLAALERERQEKRAREEERRVERTRERRERMAKELGLSGGETESFMKIQEKLDAARLQIRTQIQAGQPVDRSAVRQQMMAARSEADQAFKALLGDERMARFEQLRRDGGDRPGRGFGGPEGGGPPGARP